MLDAKLTVLSGKQQGRVIELPGGKFLVGREEDCHLRPNNDLISRHHCVFTVDDFTVRLRDLGSTNGTFVNGERLRGEVMLNAGYQVRIGKLDLQVAVGDEAPVEVPAPTGDDIASSGDSGTFALSELDAADELESARETVSDFDPAAASASDTAFLRGDTDANPQVSSDDPPTAAPDPAMQQPPTPQQGMDPSQQYPPQQMPPGYPQQPIGYVPYPGQPYGYPQYPGYMPGYPGMPYPMPGMPQQGQPSGEQQPAQETDKRKELPLRLPEPSQTGAQAPAEKADGEKKGDGGNSGSGDVKRTAEDIIRQYRTRRPGGTQ